MNERDGEDSRMFYLLYIYRVEKYWKLNHNCLHCACGSSAVGRQRGDHEFTSGLANILERSFGYINAERASLGNSLNSKR